MTARVACRIQISDQTIWALIGATRTFTSHTRLIGRRPSKMNAVLIHSPKMPTVTAVCVCNWSFSAYCTDSDNIWVQPSTYSKTTPQNLSIRELCRRHMETVHTWQITTVDHFQRMSRQCVCHRLRAGGRDIPVPSRQSPPQRLGRALASTLPAARRRMQCPRCATDCRASAERRLTLAPAQRPSMAFHLQIWLDNLFMETGERRRPRALWCAENPFSSVREWALQNARVHQCGTNASYI